MKNKTGNEKVNQIAKIFKMKKKDMDDLRGYFLNRHDLMDALIIVGPSAAILNLSIYTTIAILSDLINTTITPAQLRHGLIVISEGAHHPIKRG
jgi:hypothetical protein